MKYQARLPNIESFQVRMFEYNGNNIDQVSNFIKQYGIKAQSAIVRGNNVRYIMYAQTWGKASEEQPQVGDKYCIHPNKQCYIYTSSVFTANFKPVDG